MANRQNPLGRLDENVQSSRSHLSRTEYDSEAKRGEHDLKQRSLVHRKSLGHTKCNKVVGCYVSPSDNIMSPASAKLNAIKERRFQSSQIKPRALFAALASSEQSQGPGKESRVDILNHNEAGKCEVHGESTPSQP